MDTTTSPAPVTLSDSATRRIATILASEERDAMLRVSVSGGGCSGFQYGFTLEETRQDDDHVIEKQGAVVLIDSVSLDYMAGSEIDFVEDIIGASFQVRNPQATASCGCGTSFSL
ncbi:MAG: iron-sulfur cluster insertion protein ErpA [Parvularculales bacterium]